MSEMSTDQIPADAAHSPNSEKVSGPTTEQAPASDVKEKRASTLIPTVAIVALAVLFALQLWHSRSEMSDLRADIAQRLRSGEVASTDAKQRIEMLQDNFNSLQTKLGVIESRQGEAQSQQLALEQLYQELARTRDDWTLAEIEQVLSTANQQLQISGNVPGAIIALQNADARLAAADAQQFARIRRAIGADLERLRAVPAVDLSGIAQRIDSAIGQIDTMPLLSDEKPVLPAVQPKDERTTADPAQAGEKADWITRAQNIWHSWSQEMWGEFKQVIRVRNVQRPDALMLSPDQAYFVRENVKLRLMSARLALVARNETAFRNDLIAAQSTISHYFDTRAKPSQTVQALLRQVQTSSLEIELPHLGESLDAVRQHKLIPKSAS